MATKPKPETSTAAKIIIGLIAIIIIMWLFHGNDSKPAALDVSKLDVDAYVMSEEFIKEKLKAPATADFPGGSDGRVKYLGDSTYLVTSYVDAQNSFGANIRSNYTAKIKYVGEDKWEPIDINLMEN